METIYSLVWERPTAPCGSHPQPNVAMVHSLVWRNPQLSVGVIHPTKRHLDFLVLAHPLPSKGERMCSYGDPSMILHLDYTA